MVFQKTSPSSILLIKLRHHGDVLLATPVARTLKAHFPKCSIDFLVYEGTEPLLKNNPDLRQVWAWHRTARGWHKLWNVLQLFFRLRRQRYDLIIHLSDQMQGAFLAKFLAPQKSLGIDYPKRRHFFWRSCFSQLAPLFPSDTYHTVQQNLATLACLDLHPEGNQSQCRLVINEEDRHFVQRELQKINVTAPYLLVHPTARWFFKCWEDDRFAQVIQYFANQGWPIVLTSGPEGAEQAMVATILQKIRLLSNPASADEVPGASGAQNRSVQEVLDGSSTGATQQLAAEVEFRKKSIDSPRVHSLAGQLTLGQLAAVIEGARLFVGVDSVPMHMAAALQKDVVALFGPSKINEWHPWMTQYHLVKASDYGAMLHPDEVKTQTTERYLSNIPVEPVIAAMEEALALPKKITS